MPRGPRRVGRALAIDPIVGGGFIVGDAFHGMRMPMIKGNVGSGSRPYAPTPSHHRQPNTTGAD